jgi:hypothetical protein
VDLTWQHLGIMNLGAEVGAMDIGGYLGAMDLGAEVRVYNYTPSTVSSFYSFLFFQTTNINLKHRPSIVPLYQGNLPPFSLFCYVLLIGLGLHFRYHF